MSLFSLMFDVLTHVLCNCCCRCHPLIQTSALQARLMSSESAVMSLQHQVQQKEADLAAMKQEVSTVSLCQRRDTWWKLLSCRYCLPIIVCWREKAWLCLEPTPVFQLTARLYTGSILSKALSVPAGSLKGTYSLKKIDLLSCFFYSLCHMMSH